HAVAHGASGDFIHQHGPAANFVFAGIERSFSPLILDQLYGPEHTDSADVPYGRMLRFQSVELLAEIGAHLVRAVVQLEPLHLVDGRNRGGKSERMRFIGMAMREEVIIEK